ncbi:hypothetical protein HDE80_004519 [Rhodanobacter sp. A1T4]|nr:hypothetical protein [Rhodanobacter sp. A1T4]
MSMQTQIGIHLFQAPISSSRSRSRESSEASSPVLGFPLVKGGRADAHLTTKAIDRHTRLELLEGGHDLAFSEPSAKTG